MTRAAVNGAANSAASFPITEKSPAAMLQEAVTTGSPPPPASSDACATAAAAATAVGAAKIRDERQAGVASGRKGSQSRQALTA